MPVPVRSGMVSLAVHSVAGYWTSEIVLDASAVVLIQLRPVVSRCTTQEPRLEERSLF